MSCGELQKPTPDLVIRPSQQYIKHIKPTKASVVRPRFCHIISNRSINHTSKNRTSYAILGHVKYFSHQSNKIVEYEYDNNGMRVRKTFKSTSGYVWDVYDYTYNGKLLVHLKKNSDNMHFFYDAQGRPAMVDFNGTKYHYLYNLQGDVIGLVDTSGSLVVEYKYNAWGSILGTSTLSTAYSSLASMNPFRYRGYVYDEETWMYYCRARYYYPELQRWISVDALLGKIGTLLSHNLYCYCGNNPVALVDPDGDLAYQGEIHRAVCDNIALSNDNLYTNLNTTMIKVEDKSILYADILSVCGDYVYVYEVKRITHSAPGALRQLRKYLAASFVHEEYAGKTPLRGNEIIKGYFPFTSSTGEFYYVYYETIGFGIILYDYSPVSYETAQQTVEASYRKYENAARRNPDLVRKGIGHAGSAGSLVSACLLGLLGGAAMRREFSYT